jgi:hypothetical protein
MKRVLTSFEAGILFFIALLWFLFGIFWGLDFMDTFWFLKLSEGAARSNFMIVFSTLSGKFIQLFCDGSLLKIRLVNAFVWIVIASLSGLYLFHRHQNKGVILALVGLALCLFSPMNFNILSYDSISALFFLTAWIVLYEVNHAKRNVSNLILGGILVGFSLLSRLPSIVVLPLFMMLLFLSEKNGIDRKQIIKCMIWGLIPLCILLCFYLWMYGSVGNTFSHWDSEMSGHHQPELILYQFLGDSFSVLIRIAVLGIVFYGYRYFILQSGLLLRLLFWVSIGLVCLITGFSVGAYNRPYGLHLLSVLLFPFIFSGKRWNKQTLITLAWFLLPVLGLSAGSNTGLLKATPLVLLLPSIYKAIENSALKSFALGIWICILPLAFLQKAYPVYESHGLHTMRKINQIPGLKGIYTYAEKADLIEEVSKEAEEALDSGIQVYMLGTSGLLFHYYLRHLTCVQNGFLFTWQKNQLDRFSEQCLADRNKEALLYVFQYLPGDRWFEDYNMSGAPYFESKGFMRKNNYLLYRPSAVE